MSLQRRITMMLAWVVAILAAGWGLTLYGYMRHHLRQELDRGLALKAHTLGSLMRYEHDGRYGMDFADESMPEFLPGASAEYFQIVWPGHRTMEKSKSLGEADLVSVAGQPATATAWDMTLPDGRPGRAYGAMVMPRPEWEDRDEPPDAPRNDARVAQPMWVVVAQGRRRMDNDLRALAWGIAIATLTLIVTSAAAVRSVVRKGLSPVDSLATRAATIGPETLTDRFVPAQLPRELRPIAQGLNELLDRLQTAFAREKRVNADIAHELRTPIAELQSLAEVALRWPDNSPRANAYFADARSIALRMQRLLHQLALLANGSAARAQPTLEAFDLTAALNATLRSLQPLAAERHLDVQTAIEPALVVRTDVTMMSRILDNLLSNAIQYARDGGIVRVTAHRDGAHCLTRISNTDATLTRADLARMFEPFWRKDAARSDETHTGLGLALVGEYAARLHLDLTADLPAPDTFEIRWRTPLADAEGSAQSAD